VRRAYKSAVWGLKRNLEGIGIFGMGLLSKITGILNGPYRYRAGPNTLGIGVENLALEQPGRAVDADFYSPRYNVRGAFSTHFPTVPNTGQFLPDYDLRANGVYLSNGSPELQGLIAAYYSRAN
jgi:hypothetical protein